MAKDTDYRRTREQISGDVLQSGFWPKVSVIIPTYNRAQMVCEAIDSVLAQTLQDVEIVVVDDGSSDGTGEVLRRRYGERIRYFYQENQGRAVARNRGIQRSRGEYLLFLDSDDWLLPRALEVQAAFLDAYPEVDVVYCDGYYCDAQGREIQRISLERPPLRNGDLLETMVLHNVVVATHSALVRRRAVEALGYPYFDENLRGTEDADMWLRLAARGCRFQYLDELTCKYRLHGGNESSPRSPNFPRRRRSVIRSKLKIFNADFWPRLSLETRREFLYQLLLTFLHGELELQEQVLRSPRFQELPPHVRAHLLYYVAVDNIVQGENTDQGLARLREAVALVPGSLKYRGALFLARLGRPVLGTVITWRRRLNRLRRRPDYSLAPHWRI